MMKTEFHIVSKDFERKYGLVLAVLVVGPILVLGVSALIRRPLSSYPDALLNIMGALTVIVYASGVTRFQRRYVANMLLMLCVSLAGVLAGFGYTLVRISGAKHSPCRTLLAYGLLTYLIFEAAILFMAVRKKLSNPSK